MSDGSVTGGPTRLNATIPCRAHADVADLDKDNKPENDDPSIVEPVELANSTA
jgi:hypothetical protein